MSCLPIFERTQPALDAGWITPQEQLDRLQQPLTNAIEASVPVAIPTAVVNIISQYALPRICTNWHTALTRGSETLPELVPSLTREDILSIYGLCPFGRRLRGDQSHSLADTHILYLVDGTLNDLELRINNYFEEYIRDSIQNTSASALEEISEETSASAEPLFSLRCPTLLHIKNDPMTMHWVLMLNTMVPESDGRTCDFIQGTLMPQLRVQSGANYQMPMCRDAIAALSLHFLATDGITLCPNRALRSSSQYPGGHTYVRINDIGYNATGRVVGGTSGNDGFQLYYLSEGVHFGIGVNPTRTFPDEQGSALPRRNQSRCAIS